MRASPTYAPADIDTGTIPLKSKESFKFYEPLILLRALNDEMIETASYISPAENCDVTDPKQLFKGFVNKLALVCDSTKGDNGATVTSIWVSESNEGQVKYTMASNQRDKVALEQMAAFVTAILQKVHSAPTSPHDQSATAALLSPILEYNRGRINIYLDGLRSETRKCLDRCFDQEDENADLIAMALERLLEMYSFDEESKFLSRPEFLKICHAIIGHLVKFATSPTGRYIDGRGRDARGSTSGDCWSELRHMMSRLLAYRQALNFFLRAKAQWPRLFEKFTIDTIPSSKRDPKFNVRNKSLTADSIVGRLTRKENEIKIFRDFVSHLQPYSLDDRIVREFTKDDFRPFVHSEALLLNKIEFGGGITPERFFNGWMYIGSSKPTCKLCHYYFLEHRSGVEHRSSHGNLYPNWRFPDVLASQGSQALENRTEMLTRLLQRVRKDAFNLVRRRASPTHRAHDSLTSSARITLEDRWSSTSHADDLASMLGELDLDDENDARQGGARL